MKESKSKAKPRNRTIGLHEADYAWLRSEAVRCQVPCSILLKRMIAAYKAVQAATAHPTLEVR